MKDILIIREERNFDKSIYEFLKNKYDIQAISFSAKETEFIMASQAIPLVIVFVDGISTSSEVELRRIIMYLKSYQICFLGNQDSFEKYAEFIEKDNVHCIELPSPLDKFQRQFSRLLAQNANLNSLIKDSPDRKHSILLVDDDPVCLRTMMSWLQNFYQVAVAKSGAACIAFLGKSKPDLILLDYEMPVCNGLHTLEMIRSEADYADIPVVFLTGVSDTEKVKEAIKLKPQGYILKNTDRIEFMNKINAIFGK